MIPESFPRIDSALASCEQHLASLDSANPITIEIESGLVSYLVLVIVSEYEQFIETVFVQRANMVGDMHLSNYVRKQLSRKFRSPDLGKINETLGAFGQDYRDAFWSKIENTKPHASWDNIMKARHAVVHKEGTLNLTFRELKESYSETRTIITELIKTLGLAITTP
jgi:hypothetical protein